MIEERKLEIIDNEDKEAMVMAVTYMKIAAEIMIDQAEKRGAKIENKAGELILPFDLEEGIRCILVKEYAPEVKH